MSTDNKPTTVDLINAARKCFEKAAEEMRKATKAMKRAEKAFSELDKKGLLSPK